MKIINDERHHYTFYTGVFSYDDLMLYIEKNGDIPHCESYKYRCVGDEKYIKGQGYIAEETCDSEMFKGLPKHIYSAFGKRKPKNIKCIC